MDFQSYINHLRKRILLPLPGQEAHMRMAPLGRKPLNYYLNLNIDYRDGSVLAHFFPHDNKPYLTFIRRVEDGKTHGGQIAFPGGKKDETDADLFETALREAHEEVGINPEDVKLIGSLSNLYIPVSRYMVQPFISFSDNKPEFTINPDEVQEVIPIEITSLANPSILSSKRITTYEGVIKDAPCLVINDVTIWGATAMMLSEILELGFE